MPTTRPTVVIRVAPEFAALLKRRARARRLSLLEYSRRAAEEATARRITRRTQKENPANA